MAFSLRKRLGRKTGPTDPKTPSDANSASSSESSLTGKESTAKGSKGGDHPIAQDDLTTTPPPPNRKLRSSKDFTRDRTPPQSLLQKYQSKTARQALATEEALEGKGRKDSSVNEGSVEAFAAAVAAPAEAKKTKVKGVEFDMVGQGHSSSTNASKSKTSGVDAVRHGPTTTQQASFGHRRTRSRARREEREKAGSKGEDVLSDGLAGLKLDASLEPPPLSVRKVEPTPSPKVEEVDRDGYGEVPPMMPVVDDSFVNRNNGTQETSNKSELEKKKKKKKKGSSSHHERHDAIDHAVSNLISFPTPPTADTTNTTTKTPSSHSPSPEPKTEETPQKQKIKSILKTSSSTNTNTITNPSNLRLPVSPPRTPLPGALAGYVFCSDKSSSSRPSEPWAWCRRWTCCTCGDGDGKADVLGVGAGGERPAMTMAEQRICSRLSCGHVRCGGCRVEFRVR